MRFRATLLSFLPLLVACAGLEPSNGPVVSKIDRLSADVAKLRAEVAQTRQHLSAIDITERTARTDLAGKVDDMRTVVQKLPTQLRAQCRPQTKVSEECASAPQAFEMRGEKAVLGELETVWLTPPGLAIEARIDTGATSSSLHADNMVEFERDGEDWVRFEVKNGKDEPVEFEAAIIRTVKIVQQADPEGTKRPVVAIRVRLGQIDENVEFTLADRSHLDNPLILGRNFLKDLAVVDVARQFIQPAYEQ